MYGNIKIIGYHEVVRVERVINTEFLLQEAQAGVWSWGIRVDIEKICDGVKIKFEIWGTGRA